MKPITSNTASIKNGYQSDDENVRYKLNLEYFNNNKSPKTDKKQNKSPNATDDENIRYKFPTALIKQLSHQDRKSKPKPKIKVNFWSSKPSASKLRGHEIVKEKTNRRHTIAVPTKTAQTIKPKNFVKVRKRVSFLPSPLFSENHIPMVTVPDDLTIQLNEEEAHDLGEDLNVANSNTRLSNTQKRKAVNSITESNPKTSRRQRSTEDSSPRIHGNDNELEYFSKYVVQKLRRMETNQRIYSENLINTVLMLGQLGKLHGKSKIGDA